MFGCKCCDFQSVPNHALSLVENAQMLRSMITVFPNVSLLNAFFQCEIVRNPHTAKLPQLTSAMAENTLPSFDCARQALHFTFHCCHCFLSALKHLCFVSICLRPHVRDLVVRVRRSMAIDALTCLSISSCLESHDCVINHVKQR